MPGLLVFRPADANEVVETWRIVTALRQEPAALILSRQALPTLDRAKFAPASGVAKGAYVLAEADGGDPDVILLATGSEVHLALACPGRAAVRRHKGPRGEHALLGALRPPAPGVPRRR